MIHSPTVAIIITDRKCSAGLVFESLIFDYCLAIGQKHYFVSVEKPCMYHFRSCFAGGSNTAEMLECEKAAIANHIPGVYSRQYLPLSRKVRVNGGFKVQVNG